MKFKVLSNDGMSLKPFELTEIEAKSKEDAYEDLDESAPTNCCSDWIMTEEEFNQLKEVINK